MTIDQYARYGTLFTKIHYCAISVFYTQVQSKKKLLTYFHIVYMYDASIAAEIFLCWVIIGALSRPDIAYKLRAIHALYFGARLIQQ